MGESAGSKILEDFISLIYPNYCRGCYGSLAKGEEYICSECLLEMPKSHYHLQRNNPFYQRMRGRLPVDMVMTLYKFVKESRVQHILHALKYRHQPEIGEYLGRLYGKDLVEADYRGSFDIIVPVPLHVSRQRVRGYNQSTQFGNGLSEVLGIPCDDRVLSRATATETQTQKGRLLRWMNVSQLFHVVNPERIAGKRVLLIDDIITTGATLEACGSTLVESGCGRLSIACIAGTQ